MGDVFYIMCCSTLENYRLSKLLNMIGDWIDGEKLSGENNLEIIVAEAARIIG